MQVVEAVKAMRELGSKWKRSGETVALVPTMGALHAGHVRLIEEARKHAKTVVVSAFVNPLQFDDPKDLEAYPKVSAADRDKAKSAGATHFFQPPAEEMYPPGSLTSVNVAYLGNRLEGESRAGHFRGVCTVVTKLFNMVQPTVAVFGNKDAQQLVIIRQMVRDLNMDIKIVGVPTVRDKDGLALSSRNARLTPEQREKALCLNRALKRAHFLVKKQNITHTNELLQAVRSAVNSVGEGVELDYARIVSRITLEDLGYIEFGNTLVLIAARVGGVRLIDNTRF